jgi:hypothetical protein
VNYGLRYEIDSQMPNVDNRLSAIDLTVPRARFVIASAEDGNTAFCAAKAAEQSGAATTYGDLVQLVGLARATQPPPSSQAQYRTRSGAMIRRRPR